MPPVPARPLSNCIVAAQGPAAAAPHMVQQRRAVASYSGERLSQQPHVPLLAHLTPLRTMAVMSVTARVQQAPDSSLPVQAAHALGWPARCPAMLSVARLQLPSPPEVLRYEPAVSCEKPHTSRMQLPLLEHLTLRTPDVGCTFCSEA